MRRGFPPTTNAASLHCATGIGLMGSNLFEQPQSGRFVCWKIRIFSMTPRQQFSPLCDVLQHHTSMQRRMLEEDSEATHSFHACGRRDCMRVFRDSGGYSDRIEGKFDHARAEVRVCPSCGAVLYLAEGDRLRKTETWECAKTGCEYSEGARSPSAR